MSSIVRKPIFDAVRTMLGRPFSQGEVTTLDAAIDRAEGVIVVQRRRDAVTGAPVVLPTAKIMLEIIEHEAIVCEAYKDSVGIWTWGVGVTDASGHKVGRYKDKPATVLRCLEVYEWLIRTKYLPEVLEAFKGHPLSENQLGGALSFHWNTGGILKASWVRSFKAGNLEQAHAEMLNWVTPREIIGRRKAERALFFDGVWTSDGLVTVYGRVRKPSYTPDWGSARQIDIRPMLADVMQRAGV